MLKSNDTIVSKRQVKDMIHSNMDRIQSKYLSSVIYNAVIPTLAGNLVQPTLPAQGTTNGQREGDSLYIDLIETRINLYNEQASIGIADIDIIRVIVLQARASTVLTTSNFAAPLTGVLDLGSSGGVDLTSFINFNSKNEVFHVLHDQCYSVNFGGNNAAHHVDLYLKPKVAKINFQVTATAPLCGGIFYIAQALFSNATLSIEQRLIYHDL